MDGYLLTELVRPFLHGDLQDPSLELGFHLVGIDVSGERKGARKRSKSAFGSMELLLANGFFQSALAFDGDPVDSSSLEEPVPLERGSNGLWALLELQFLWISTHLGRLLTKGIICHFLSVCQANKLSM